MPKPKSKRATPYRRARFDITAASMDAGSTVSDPLLARADSSQQVRESATSAGVEVPPVPKELQARRATDKWSLEKISAVIAAILAIVGTIVYVGMQWGDLTRNVSQIGEDVRDIKTKTERLLVDDSKATWRLDQLEHRTSRLEDTRATPHTTTKMDRK